MALLPSTTRRVPRHTAAEVNERIRRETLRNIERYRHAPRGAVMRRIKALEHEWDIERAIEANAASIALTGLALGVFADRRFLVLPAAVMGFLLQHALQGWCPPVPVLRRLGFRTQTEIEEERHALEEHLERTRD
jgi:hypothetical protein